MVSKLSPIIIVVLLVVVVVIAIVIFGIATGTGGFVDSNDDKGTTTEELIKPVLTLDKKVEEEKENTVKITAKASTEDKEGISEIILPDGSSVKGDYAVFEATENKKYEFTVKAVNGSSETLSIEVNEIDVISATNPYVPEGFSVVSNDIDKGFVIQDENENQYVWIPVESGKLTRSRMLNGDYEETSTSATELVNSVAKYYGFYIARFEASEYEVDGEKVAASMAGKNPWTNITYLEALEYSNKSAEKFKYEDCYTTLLNSYAWDTVLNWVDKNYENYSSSINYGNYSYTILPTGTSELDIVNNICDLAGNIKEWTTEIYKKPVEKDPKSKDDNVKYRVVRGGSANLSRTPSSYIGYPENTSDNYWGFRLVLYK